MHRKLQVFVSSTFTDLISERQAAVTAILKAGHMPAGMELFTAGDKSQWDTITHWIDECDVYMLILGGRYGTLEPSSGLSYTELEYDYAISKGKPHFAIVARDEAIESKVRTRGREVIEQDNPSQLKAFRQKVLAKISTFFDDEKDIRLAVMESLMQLSTVHADAGWVRASKLVDTKSLEETIVRLREENSAQLGMLKKLEARVEGTAAGIDHFASIHALLQSTQVLLPPSLSREDLTSASLLRICTTYLDTLVSGVYSTDSSDIGAWLYSTIIPKLVLHGLAGSEKPAGVYYWKAKLTPEGLKFFSRLQQQSFKDG